MLVVGGKKENEGELSVQAHLFVLLPSTTMSSFPTFLPRIALRTSAVYTSSLPRLYRLTSKSVDPCEFSLLLSDLLNRTSSPTSLPSFAFPWQLPPRPPLPPPSSTFLPTPNPYPSISPPLLLQKIAAKQAWKHLLRFQPGPPPPFSSLTLLPPPPPRHPNPPRNPP